MIKHVDLIASLVRDQSIKRKLRLVKERVAYFFRVLNFTI